uniref:Ig-like domain-containing protein n=1 Tax=Timema monikensis TaxID=170555 RepID=A0A7R9HKI0_9NEOP|nr:unnamed protein product [Timema monikensis]
MIAGKPEPSVRWLVNGVQVDEEYEHNAGDVIENRLMWPAVGRQDLNSVFSCQAINTLLTEPKETSLVLDLHLKPLTARILTKVSPLIADQRYEVSCESAGSRPPAVITWYKGKRQLRKVKVEGDFLLVGAISKHPYNYCHSQHQTNIPFGQVETCYQSPELLEETRENVTVSDLSFIPGTEDDGKSITCRAENPNITHGYLEASWKIDVGGGLVSMQSTASNPGDYGFP